MFFKQLFPALTKNSIVLSNIRSTVPKGCYNTPNLELVRYAARKGTRAAQLRAKKANKLKEAGKPKPIPKYLQRKVKVSAELERKRCKDENWLESQPIDNVYNMKLYRGKPYTLADALEMHRETHSPEMLNETNALVYVNVEIDLRLKKKDRYMDDLTGIITFKNEFDVFKKNRVIVVCKSEEDQIKATDAGAIYAGSAALVKQILSGTVSRDEFDYVIGHPDMLKEMSTLRGILGKKFPNTNNGLLRLDIEPAVKSFLQAIEFKLKRSNTEPDFGWVDIPIGRLSMPFEHLEQNLKQALENVERYKPTGTPHILFIIRTLLFCDKSREKFKIPHWQYLSNYPENGIAVDEEDDVDQIKKN